MTSRLTVNNIESNSGISSIALDSGVTIAEGSGLNVSSGIVTASTVSVGGSITASNKFYGDASQLTAIPGANITGTIPAAALGNVDLTGVRKDIATLALQIAVDTNRAAYNLQDSFVDQFEDDTGLVTQTNTDRSASGEFIGTGDYTEYRYFKFQYTNASNSGYPKIYETNFYTEADGGGTSISKSGVTGSMVTGSEYSSSDGVAAAADGNESTYLQIDNGTANVAFKLDFGSGVAHRPASLKFKHQQHNIVSNIQLLGSNNDSDYTSIGSWAGPNSGYFIDGPAGGQWTGTYNTTTTISATGTTISKANTASSSRTKVTGVVTYKNKAGTATLGTDLKVFFTCNGGTNWTEAASYTAGSDFSTGVKTIYLGETTCTAGTDVRYKVEWANQSASKETEVHGIAINY